MRETPAAAATSSSVVRVTGTLNIVCIQLIARATACISAGEEGVGAENLIWLADQGRCTRKNVGTCRATYVPNSVAPAVRQDPDGDLEILVSNPFGFFGTHRRSY